MADFKKMIPYILVFSFCIVIMQLYGVAVGGMWTRITTLITFCFMIVLGYALFKTFKIKLIDVPVIAVSTLIADLLIMGLVMIILGLIEGSIIESIINYFVSIFSDIYGLFSLLIIKCIFISIGLFIAKKLEERKEEKKD